VRRWSAVAAARVASSERCTFVAAPTPFLLDVVEHAEAHGAGDFATLRFFLCGGAAVQRPLLERARRVLPRTDVTAYYGTSECGGVTTNAPEAPLAKKLTTEGSPLPGLELALADDELSVRGTQVAARYWSSDPDRQFDGGGWFRTGDLATMDEDGYVRIIGRRKELIIRGGVNVAPAEVEDVVASHPAVREVAVLGAPDERLGERVAAVVVSAGAAPSVEEVQALCQRAGLAKVKWPELVISAQCLPRTPAGKLRRAELARSIFGA
jgi:acyl-CoA synthetase (AMP-forming)/AMP-acid ligase II